MIVAKTDNHVIGKNNGMPWHLPADLKYFKQLTSGHAVIMGKRTFESIGKALPNRVNIVLSSQFPEEGLWLAEKAFWGFGSLEAALKLCRQHNPAIEKVFLIGGNAVFKAGLTLANHLYLTHIFAEIEGDTFFPWPLPEGWVLAGVEEGLVDEKNTLPHAFAHYIKEG